MSDENFIWEQHIHYALLTLFYFGDFSDFRQTQDLDEISFMSVAINIGLSNALRNRESHEGYKRFPVVPKIKSMAF